MFPLTSVQLLLPIFGRVLRLDQLRLQHRQLLRLCTGLLRQQRTLALESSTRGLVVLQLLLLLGELKLQAA